MRLFVLSVLSLACIAGCGGSDQIDLPGRIGKGCTVYFRRDALGMSADLPAPPASSNLNGAGMTISGTLLETSQNWIRLGTDDHELTIPSSVILMIEQ